MEIVFLHHPATTATTASAQGVATTGGVNEFLAGGMPQGNSSG